MRTIVFIDGQNLYHLARDAWSSSPPYSWPSYDVEKLANALTSRISGRTLQQVRFYTGVPNSRGNPFWHGFWNNKLRFLRNGGIYTYRGRVNSGGQEKGVDVTISLDLVQATYRKEFEVAIIVSQDSDFGPAVRVAKSIAKSQGRRLVFESAFPVGPGSNSRRGVPGTTWVQIDKATYDSCLDHKDYRPRL